MARKVIWTYEATVDLLTLAEYITRDSPFYASAFVQEIMDSILSLNEFSERGRIVPELGNANIRELFVKDYRLIYSIEESNVIILGIIHSKRDLKSLWEREKRNNIY